MNIFLKDNKTYFLLLSLLALGLLSACSHTSPAANPSSEPLSPPDRIDIVYFYDSQICHCQIAPGEHIQGTLFVNFNGEQTSGKFTYRMIDLTDKNNAAIISKYGATSQSLFVDLVKAGNERTIAVPEFLLVKDDDEALDRLITARIQRYLAGEE
jgi:hypothetical protein